MLEKKIYVGEVYVNTNVSIRSVFVFYATIMSALIML